MATEGGATSDRWGWGRTMMLAIGLTGFGYGLLVFGLTGSVIGGFLILVSMTLASAATAIPIAVEATRRRARTVRDQRQALDVAAAVRAGDPSMIARANMLPPEALALVGTSERVLAGGKARLEHANESGRIAISAMVYPLPWRSARENGHWAATRETLVYTVVAIGFVARFAWEDLQDVSIEVERSVSQTVAVDVRFRDGRVLTLQMPRTAAVDLVAVRRAVQAQ